MASPSKTSRIQITQQAGGGAPSSAAYHHRVISLNPVILSHLEQAFENICKESSNGGNKGLGQAAASHFLANIQQESVPEAAKFFTKDVSGIEDFLAYMCSPAASAMAAPKKHDLSHPISSYYISSSHNTYLTGNQLYSDASTDPYKDVLLRGCRCLEIDVWDGESKSGSSSASSSDAEGEGGRKASPRKKSGLSSRVSGHVDTIKQRARSISNSSRGKSPSSPQKVRVPTPDPPAEVLQMPAPWRIESGELRPEPRVLHGYTLTKEVSFRAVCNAIAETAFVATDLPIIVSLEVHASLEQQETMVEIMKEAWKGMLVDTSDALEGQTEHLPSPDQLRKKILIKVKWAPAAAGEGPNAPLEPVPSTSSGEEENGAAGDKKKASKILPALSQLGVYTRAFTFKNFTQPEAAIPSHVFSLSEAKAVDMHESSGDALFSHNRDYLMRAYPSGMRVNSSNLEPLFLWSQGVQMAALNWQSWDKGMMLNEGMFAGEEGWVLKPEGYRGTIKDSDAGNTVRKRNLDLTIELFAGQNLPLPSDEKAAKKFHPYVKCDLLYPTDKTSSEDSTKSNGKRKRVSKTNKGADPDFHGEPLRFSNVSNVVEELSFIR